MFTIKKLLKMIVPAVFCLMTAVTAHAYNVVDLPESMTLSDAFGIFSSDEITYMTVSDVADGKFIELTAEEIQNFYSAAENMTVTRTINPTPFRGIAVNVYTESGVKSYYMNSGIQIGLYGKDNYVCYKLDTDDTESLLYLDSLYKDETKSTGESIHRATENDFLKLPSDPWAQPFVIDAASKNLLPYEFTGNYSASITRENFCKLLGNMITVKANYASLDMYMFDRGQAYLRNYFSDCSNVDDSVNILHALGIVNGKDSSHFDPDGTITREEAATLLSKTAEMYMWLGVNSSLSYSDAGSVSQWAKFYVTWVTEKGIMSGITSSEFSPQGSYTVEQAIATITRLYDLIS